jgi:hypothetical protein
LYKVLNRITLAGAVFLGLIAVLPYIIQSFTSTKDFVPGWHRYPHRRGCGHRSHEASPVPNGHARLRKFLTMLFHLPRNDSERFVDFLKAHNCHLDLTPYGNPVGIAKDIWLA